MTRDLRDELKKKHAFESLQQETTLALLRTADLLENRIARLLREHKLTGSQYNVLRILRGEGRPMPCLEVADRMIQVAPAITRVVDQLLKLKLIRKTQSDEDRRVFLISLTPSAKRLLKKLDQPVLDLHERLLNGIPQSEQKTLLRTLSEIREQVETEIDA